MPLTTEQMFELKIAFNFKNAVKVSAILSKLPENERLDAVAFTDREDGITLLHFSVVSEALFVAMFGSLPTEDRIKAANLKDKFGNTVLHFSVKSRNANILFSLLDLFTNDHMRFDAVNAKNENGESVLQTAHNVEMTSVILKSLAPKYQLMAVNSKDKLGNTVLHNAVIRKNLERIKTIQSFFSTEQKSDLVNSENQNGETVLYTAMKSRNEKRNLKMMSALTSYTPSLFTQKQSDDAKAMNSPERKHMVPK